MKVPPKFKKNSCRILTAVILAGLFTSLPADEKSLEETLQRMESLLQQQQQELEAQRKELAEQRVLIQKLQEDRDTSVKEPLATPPSDPGELENVATTGSEEKSNRLVEDSRSVEERLAESDPGSGKEQALAELSRRESGDPAAKQEVPVTTIMEDPSNTTYDADFPGAWHLPGTTAAMKISGYVNLALINSFDPMLISDRFIVGSIPADGQDVAGAKSGTDVTANQTRINYEVREETKYGTLRAFIEGDFEGQGDSFRLRHAFGQYYWGLAGKTWSTLMDLESRPEEVDFEGINGMILSRQAQFRMFPKFGESMEFKFSLEDPKTDVINGTGARGHADIIMSVDKVPLKQIGLSDWSSRVAVIIRDLEADQYGQDGSVDDENVSADTFGWGITTSGKKSLRFWAEDDYLLWQLTYGKGVGRYLNDLSTVGGGDAVFDPQGKLRPLPVFAGYVSYRHNWPKGWRVLKSWPGTFSSNLIFSWVSIDNYDFQDDKAYKSTLRASANFIYLPTNNFRLGAELLWGKRKNKDNSSGDATQVQISARYNF